jgi:hypothetical protein
MVFYKFICVLCSVDVNMGTMFVAVKILVECGSSCFMFVHEIGKIVSHIPVNLEV